jgi:hypothetical protein
MATAAVAGCGGDDEPASAPQREATATPTATPTPTRTPEPKPTRARSLGDCVDIWNSDVEAGKTSQVTAADYVADNAKEGRTKVRVQLRQGRCLVVIPIGGRRVAVFVKVPDRDLYTVPERQTLPQGARVAYNARGRRDGSIALR